MLESIVRNLRIKDRKKDSFICFIFSERTRMNPIPKSGGIGA